MRALRGSPVLWLTGTMSGLLAAGPSLSVSRLTRHAASLIDYRQGLSDFSLFVTGAEALCRKEAQMR